MSLMARLWNMPLRNIARKLKRRLAGDRSLDLEELVTSPKHMRPQRFYDFLSRYEAILGRTGGWTPLDFSGKRVLEIGCGPMLGFGPLAIMRGAADYTAIEPEFDARVLGDMRFVTNYFGGIHKDLSALYGEGPSMAEFIERLRSKTTIVRQYLLEAELEGPFDIVLSNSCLEHISPFVESMQALHRSCTPETRFLHLVDFGSHRTGPNPFESIYARNPAAYISRHGRHINLLRPSEIVNLMREAGFDVGFERYASMPENFGGPMHEHWASRYSEDELFTKTGIVFGPAGAQTSMDCGSDIQ